jgi:hypothetical protein
MDRTRFITLSALVSLGYGLAALIAPAALTSLFRISLDRTGLFLAQFLGASYIGYALIGWFVRASADPLARRGLALGKADARAIGVGVSTTGMIDGVAGPVGWSMVPSTAVFAAAWAYLALTATGDEARGRGVARNDSRTSPV